MKSIKSFVAALIAAISMMPATAAMAQEGGDDGCGGRWSEEKANEWYSRQPWMSGCCYIPATAINQIEMWSKSTFDPKQIDKELGWAQELGFKTMRVFLSSVVYLNDPDGLKKRIDKFLDICSSHGIRPMLVFFDDCWNPESHYGKQPEPKKGVHNSGWVQDPSASLRADTAKLYAEMGKYVKDIVTTFGKDERVLMWDLYNEPGNREHLNKSLPLLRKAFQWARSCHPVQPLTSGIWRISDEYKELAAFQLEHSDVISYHNYHKADDHATEIAYLKMLNRPLVCSEYMARTNGSTFQTIMPLLKKNKVVAINWGFVTGKTNTRFVWNTPLPDADEPPVWLHDIYRQDKTPYSKEEVDLIKSLNEVK